MKLKKKKRRGRKILGSIENRILEIIYKNTPEKPNAWAHADTVG
jgi:hypothetical protein